MLSLILFPAFVTILYMKLGMYKHFKGNLYKVLGMVKHSETREDLVLYEALYDNPLGKLWVRPREMFEEVIEIEGKKVKRFMFIKPA